jgi:hypothetical protein
MGQFDTNYIIFINVKIFKNTFFSEIKIVKENDKCDGICEIISFVKMESSKLINYLTNMCSSDHQGTGYYSIQHPCQIDLCSFTIRHTLCRA